MNLAALRRHAPAIIAVLFMGGLVAVGLSMKPPEHDAVLAAAMADLVSHGTLSGTIRIETLVGSDTLGIGAKGVPAIRLPIGVAGPFRASLGKDSKPVFAADLSLALEGGETLPSAPGVDLVTDGHGATVIRPKNFPASPLAGVDMKNLNGKWLRVTAKEFVQLTGGDVAETSAVVTPRDPDLAPLKAMIAGGLLRIGRPMADEVVDGKPTRHYAVVPDPKKLTAFIQAANTAFLGRELTDADREALARKSGGFTLVAEAWLDKDAAVLRKFGFDLRPVAGNDAAPLRIVIEFGPAEQQVTDTVPAEAQDIMETFLKEVGSSRVRS